jgi:hypothetical protein
LNRIQRKGYADYSWRNNPNAIYVGRPSIWGNPYRLSEYELSTCLRYYEMWLKDKLKNNPHFLDELKGKDLVCWCPLSPGKVTCHADILIRYVESLL